jgi:hypothetical protein
MPVAAYFFIAGVLLGLVCGFRISVRTFRVLLARQRARRPDPWADAMIDILERIELRDTAGLEIIGLPAGFVMFMVAIRFLEPA